MAITRTDRNQRWANGVLVSDVSVVVDVTAEVNTAALVDLPTLQTKMAELKSFLTDVDVQVVVDIANTTALTTQQLNRALKAIIRQQRRAANFELRLARYVLGQLHPALLDDITDT